MHEQLFEKLESDRFSATINVVSGLNQFVRDLSWSAEVQEVLVGIQSSTDLLEIAERFDLVAARETDPTYENPWDVALAAYLLILARVDPKQAMLCAGRASIGSNGWWAKKIAKILSGHEGGLPEQVQACPTVSSGV